MTRSQTYVIAAAILAGSAVISIGLYAGLSASSEPGIAQREPPPAPAEVGRWLASSGRPAPSAEPAPPTPASARTPPPEPSPELQRRASQELLARLYADRATYLERCGARAAAQNQGGAQGSFRFDVVFDASGREIARGIHSADDGSRGSRAADPGAAARAEILDCLQGVGDLPASITPPGRSLEVSVTFPFP